MTRQQSAALQLANDRRMAAARLREEVACGTLPLEAALGDPRAGCMDVSRLLCAQRGLGPTKVKAILGGLGINPTRKVRDLTVRQREAIAGGLSSMDGTPPYGALAGRIEFSCVDAQAVSEALRAALVALHQGVEPNLLWAPTYRLAIFVAER